MDRTEIEKTIRDLSGQGKNYQQISDSLNREKIPTFSGKGIWGKGTVYKFLKKNSEPAKIPLPDSDLSENRQSQDDISQEKTPVQEPVTISEEEKTFPEPDIMPEPKTPEPDELHTMRKAYQSVLAELDKAKAEIAGLHTELQEKQDRIGSLKKQINELTQDKHNRQRDIQDILNTSLTQERTEGSDGILSEILNRLTRIEQNISTGSPGAEKRKAVNIAGWTIQRDRKGFYRAFRNIGGKIHAVYLGKNFDEKLINIKLTNKFQEITGQNQAIPEDDARADRGGAVPRKNTGELLPEPEKKPDQVLFRRAYDRIGKGRGFVRIHRIRDLLKWEPERFNRVLQSLLADYSAEIHRGDPSVLTEQEIRDSYTDESGTRYITLTFWK